MPHYYSFYEDFISNEEVLNIKKATESLTIPQLIIHGKMDEAVPFNEAELLNEWNPQSELYSIDSTGHTFDTKHPWQENQLPEAMQMIVDKTARFIKSWVVLKAI
jgi:pimeloyl-ACP methyl ester carboxylesterase